MKQEEVELTKENADNDNDLRLQHGLNSHSTVKKDSLKPGSQELKPNSQSTNMQISKLSIHKIVTSPTIYSSPSWRDWVKMGNIIKCCY